MSEDSSSDRLAGFPPGFLEAIGDQVKTAVDAALTDCVDVDAKGILELKLAFEQCSKKLQESIEHNRDLLQDVLVYKELADLIRTQSERRAEELESLQALSKSLKNQLSIMERNNGKR